MVDERNYWDVSKHLAKVEAYRDFEGLANPDEEYQFYGWGNTLTMTEAVRVAMTEVGLGEPLLPTDMWQSVDLMTRDIIVNLVHEAIDQAEPPNWSELIGMCEGVHAVLECNLWMKVALEDVADPHEDIDTAVGYALSLCGLLRELLAIEYPTRPWFQSHDATVERILEFREAGNLDGVCSEAQSLLDWIFDLLGVQ